MLSFRCAGICLIGLAFAAWPMRLPAASTAVVTPPAGTGATTAPRIPSTIALPGAAPAAPGTLPAVMAPPQIAAPTPGTSAPPPPLGTPIPEGSDAEKSVVQIFTEFVEPNWAAPWIFDLPRRASGTGFLIDGNRIMTNAHVVAWTTQLVVRRYHDPQPYFAKVEFVAHDIDLAVIKIIDPVTGKEDPNSDFYKGMKPS
jgi:S1-C subfamily serine protease